MIQKSPSGALSPYYYKNGFFHGIHYGSYFDDFEAFYNMMAKEEAYIIQSTERRRILMDLYETNLNQEALERLVHHIEHIEPRVTKLAFSCEKRKLHTIQKALKKANVIDERKTLFEPDMETAKTWLVSER